MMYEIQTYLGADGLMHCTVCKEPVEAFYPKGSLLEMRKHHRQCACERKAYAEETQYYKEKEHRELIARNKKIILVKNALFEHRLQLATVDICSGRPLEDIRIGRPVFQIIRHFVDTVAVEQFRVIALCQPPAIHGARFCQNRIGGYRCEHRIGSPFLRA